MLKELKKNLKRYKLLNTGDTVVVGASGGRDSMALLFGLHSLRDELQIKVVAAHFNHALRGEAANGDEDFVRTFCEEHGIIFVSTTMPINELSTGKNLQETARFYRYRWLNEIADSYGNTETAKIATAHHAQDQAETVLLHLFRGSGSQGLKAMEPKAGRLIRPLLNVEREVLEAYLAKNQVGYRDDASNFSDHYTRNRIRLELMPELLHYNPALIKALVNTADICKEEDNFLAVATLKLMHEIVLPCEGGYSVNRKGLTKASPALQRRLVRKLWQKLSCDEGGGLSYEHTEAVLRLVKGKKLPLPQKVMAKVDSNNIYLLRRDKDYLSTPKPKI
jgi:tRNA(Ile)-lysidine synthase